MGGSGPLYYRWMPVCEMQRGSSFLLPLPLFGFVFPIVNSSLANLWGGSKGMGLLEDRISLSFPFPSIIPFRVTFLFFDFGFCFRGLKFWRGPPDFSDFLSEQS